MLKPRVPGYHGNQIKRRISSESRNLNYSDSFTEGKMKIPFTLQPLPHSKCRGREKKTKRNGKCFCCFYLTMRLKATPSKISGCLVLNQDARAQHTVDTQWNDVTSVLINHHLNLLPFKGAIICVNKSPAHVRYDEIHKLGARD